MATLIMVAKYPQPGRCKTRLAAGLGTDGAAAFARAALCDLLERFAGEAALGRRVLLFAPRDEREVRAGGAGARAEPCACARHAARMLPPLHAGLGVLGAACALRLGSGALTALSAAGVRRSAAGAWDRCRRRMVRVSSDASG